MPGHNPQLDSWSETTTVVFLSHTSEVSLAILSYTAPLRCNLSTRQALPQGGPEGGLTAALPHHTRSQQAGRGFVP
jgi:hypothetical protein